MPQGLHLESDPKAVPQSLATQMVANAMAVSQPLDTWSEA